MATGNWVRSAVIVAALGFGGDALADFDEAQAAFNTGRFEKAKDLLEPLAEDGDARAQYALGAMYQNGLAVEKDYGKALAYYQASAGQGYPSGQFGLGALYEKGSGVEQNYEEAAKWYRLSAEQTDIEKRWPGNRGPKDGSAFAQNALGKLYETGRGVPKDLDEAKRWYTMSADYGYTVAKQNLERLKGLKSE
ncbi:MAG: hypothetical protein CMM50_11255 [Rhodospirillaceae bacterium]|nr:hypothetical protein [Rhodospirillaceae bacterium]|tara:strand:+ start:463 stop:1041 length:579 start_codon:yes stop_codon:yes gene_type:complete